MNRRFEDILMPVADAGAIMHPEFALLKWEALGNRLDVGQLCYLKRDTSRSRRELHTFDPASISKDRVKAVRKLIAQLSEKSDAGGSRPATVYLDGRVVINLLNWADRRGMHQALCARRETEVAIKAYFSALRELASQSKLSVNSAAAEQRTLLSVLKTYFEADDFGADLRPFRFRRNRVVGTEVPDSERQGLLIAWADAVFTGLGSNVLQFTPYPFVIGGAAGQTVQVLPNHYGRRDGDASWGLKGWNLKTGEPRTYKELKQRYIEEGSKYPTQHASTVVRTTSNQIKEANSNARASIRLAHAITSAYAFAVLFLAETGINLSQLMEMDWCDDLVNSVQSPSVVRQKFREVKYRAGGVEIAFKVSVAFMPKLKAYLALRGYLAKDATVDKLFLGADSVGKAANLNAQFMRHFYQRLESLGIVLPEITPRQWRAAKQDWAISNHGPVVAAGIMGHTLDTALRSYSNGTDAAHKSEMGAFFASVEKTVLEAGVELPGSLNSSVGACVKFQSPESISASVAVKPDCKSSEGCLFCGQYRVHADATDIRKLLSCRYCVRLTCGRVETVEQYDASFGTVLRRLDFLLDELRKRDGALVASIENDVDVMGNLDPFWESKLEQLFELGLA
ncbi:integrase [Caballeronia glebae]|uniref:integrase n=1 Tax=Caballeronia glebae TaxID=1777143 RepID=UPI0038B70F85